MNYPNLNRESTHLSYKPHIDGLRGVAVLSVMLFHLHLVPLTGGFLGVDVFFVISGYLITNNIVSGIAAGTFTIRSFYLRRIRRIVPALLITLVLCFVVAAAVASPVELAEFARTAIAAILSVSNIYFWANSGYFEVAATTRPLLHTWSLGVEEQFYFLWPLLLVLISRLPKFWFPTLILAGAFFSVAVAEGLVVEDRSSVFYLAHFRAFELAMGAAILWCPRTVKDWVADTCCTVGLLMMVLSFVMFNSDSYLPGLRSLIPVVGAALVIYAGESRAGWLLSNPPLVWLGQISYSLYLVHWPIIVFTQYVLMRDIGRKGSMIVLCVSIALAFLMYRFVETPFRVRRERNFVVSNTRLVTLVGFGVAALIALGTSASMTGWVWRLSDQQVRLTSPDDQKFHERFYGGVGCTEPYCETSPGAPQRIYVIGDSHAYAYFDGLRRHFPDINFVFFVASACEFFSVEYVSAGASNSALCEKARGMAFDALSKRPSNVVISQEWSIYMDREYVSTGGRRYTLPKSVDSYAQFVAEELADVQKLVGSDYRVVVLGDVHRFKSSSSSPLDCVTRPIQISVCETSLLNGPLNKLPADINSTIASKLDSALFVDATRYLCKDGVCQNFHAGLPLYSDWTHLSIWGSRLMAETMWRDVVDALMSGGSN